MHSSAFCGTEARYPFVLLAAKLFAAHCRDYEVHKQVRSSAHSLRAGVFVDPVPGLECDVALRFVFVGSLLLLFPSTTNSLRFSEKPWTETTWPTIANNMTILPQSGAHFGNKNRGKKNTGVLLLSSFRRFDPLESK